MKKNLKFHWNFRQKKGDEEQKIIKKMKKDTIKFWGGMILTIFYVGVASIIFNVDFIKLGVGMLIGLAIIFVPLILLILMVEHLGEE